MKLQIKTQKVLDLISKMKRNLKEDNYISIYYFTYEDMIDISYSTCIRRDHPYQVAKRYKNDIQKFIDIYNQSSLSRNNKMRDFIIDTYKDDEYSEYEIEVGRSIKIKLGKNQGKFFKNF